MQRFKESWETKEKYRSELTKLGASSINIAIEEQKPNGKIKTVRIFIQITVHDSTSKIAIEEFLAKQKHPGRLDRFPVKIIVRDRKNKNAPL